MTTDTYERAITAERKLRWLRAYVESVEVEPESVDLEDVIEQVKRVVAPASDV